MRASPPLGRGRANYHSEGIRDAGLMGIFAGDRPIIVGVLTAIGVEQGVLYWRYRHQVGEDNTSVQGFRHWRAQTRIRADWG